MLRGSHFYDDVYKSSNDNDSPLTVNKTGDHREFTSRTRKDSGSKARLLDAYVFGDFPLGEQQYLSVKAGRHLLAWGESLFWPNISQGQVPVDSTKFNVPGTEAKDAYLPVGQVSAAWSLNQQFTLTGFYQYEWEKTLLNPVGDYFGSDYFGPGAQLYRLAPGVINSLPDTSFTALTYAGEEKPRDSGQWGVGLRYAPIFSTEFGLYHYRYHDRVAAMFFDFSGTTHYSSAPELDGLGYGPGVPSYKFGYFEDIKLTGLSFTTKYRDVQIGGDLSLRQDAPVYLSNGAPTTGDLLMTNLNFLYMLGPNRFAHQTTLSGELLNERIQRVDTLRVSGGGAGVDGAYDDYEYDGQTRSSTLLGLGAYFDYPGLFSGWDLNTRVVWMQALDGSGTQGLGRDEKRLTLGADFKYLATSRSVRPWSTTSPRRASSTAGCWPTATTSRSTSSTRSDRIRDLFMHVAKQHLLLGLALQFGVAGVALAAATEADISRLGQDLTCVGAEKAGNADGSIPEWSGKWLGVPPHVSFTGTGAHPIDPYPDDKPLFVITAQNLAEHESKLSDGRRRCLPSTRTASACRCTPRGGISGCLTASARPPWRMLAAPSW